MSLRWRQFLPQYRDSPKLQNRHDKRSDGFADVMLGQADESIQELNDAGQQPEDQNGLRPLPPYGEENEDREGDRPCCRIHGEYGRARRRRVGARQDSLRLDEARNRKAAGHENIQSRQGQSRMSLCDQRHAGSPGAQIGKSSQIANDQVRPDTTA